MSSRRAPFATLTAPLALAAALVAPSAGAAPVGELHRAVPPTPELDERTTRNGLVLGLMGGFGFAGASGYPNKASQIDDPRFYSSSDLLAGSGGSFFAMGALADYLNFGFWFGGGSYESRDWRSSGGGGGFRVELFPLFVVVPKLKDLGVMAQFGLGSATLEAKVGDYPKAEGVQSFIGTGLFYEWTVLHMLGGHVVAGPSLEYDAIFARSMDRDALMLGGRIAFYGGL